MRLAIIMVNFLPAQSAIMPAKIEPKKAPARANEMTNSLSLVYMLGHESCKYLLAP